MYVLQKGLERMQFNMYRLTKTRIVTVTKGAQSHNASFSRMHVQTVLEWHYKYPSYLRLNMFQFF